ncbi:hypothetical protein [Pasteurella multocida]
MTTTIMTNSVRVSA